jgi:hypothetical protein
MILSQTTINSFEFIKVTYESTECKFKIHLSYVKVGPVDYISPVKLH